MNVYILKKMSWLIFGGNGWIGNQFCQLLDKRNIVYDLASFRMDDMYNLYSYLYNKRPRRVISFIGRTHGPGFDTIDYLEQGRSQLMENIRDNLFAPIQCAILCQELDIHFTYLGTGCIFNYDDKLHKMNDEKGFFDEQEEPNFFGSSYSIVKGFTDRLMHLFPDNVLNLRIRMPINADIKSKRNFITKITSYEKICSLPNSMTVLPDMFPIILNMIIQEKTGTYNMTNPGVITHQEILDLYKEIVDPTFTYQLFSLEEQSKILKADRSNNGLDTTKLQSEYKIPTIHESIKSLFINHAQELRKKKLI